MVIVPSLVRFLRPYYRREIKCSLLVEEDMIDYGELESETSDHLHVHLAVASCVVKAVSFLILAASTTNRALIICKSSLTMFSFVCSLVQLSRNLHWNYVHTWPYNP